MSLDLAAVHDVALDIVEKAGRLAFSYFDNIERLTVEFKEARDDLKTHHSPVTQADLQVEQLIRACIQQSYPDHGIIGEEYENEGVDSEYVWVIDPIDGTRSFSRGLKSRGVLLSLMHRGEIVLGVSYLPAFEEMLSAWQGGGAWCNGQQVSVSRRQWDEAVVYHERRKYFVRDGLESGFDTLCSEAYYTKQGDSALMHALTKGQIEAAIGPTTPLYDFAPYVIIVREAGGRVTTLDGGEIDAEHTSYVMSNGVVHEQLLGYFGG